MGIIELILLSIGLGMDAFAVSICKGISMKKMDWKKACIIGLYFGGFQAIMPIIGYFLGSTFESFITSFDHWVAFILLAVIGGNMIKESSCTCEDYNKGNLCKHIIATSMERLQKLTISIFCDNFLLASHSHFEYYSIQET